VAGRWRVTGKTIAFITHSIDEAVFLGSRMMVAETATTRWQRRSRSPRSKD
jgi:ABC-type taurine transport system ATPase subunit